MTTIYRTLSLLWVASLCILPADAVQAEAPGRKPNIVILMADDLGWNDVGYHGSTVKTPHIDRFVREGIELDRFYVAPYCVPTRAGLMTGHYPHRFGLTYKSNFARNARLPAEAVTLAEVLSAAGYSRRACVGKWHLGDGEGRHPLRQGFTDFYGLLGGMVHYFDHRTIPFGANSKSRPRVLDWHRHDEISHDKGYTTDLIGFEAVRFIERQSKDQPFLLYVPFNAPHLPLHAKLEHLDPADRSRGTDTALYTGTPAKNRRLLAAMVASLDENIGRILTTIDQQELRSDTVVLFFSDNGGMSRFGVSDNSPLRGEKNTLWEGGVRVPAAVRWPGVWPGKRKVSEPVAYIDLLPTLASLAGAENLPENLDGRNVADVLSNEVRTLDRNIYLGPKTIVTRDWKLTGQSLYAISSDAGEMENVAAENPAVVERLRREILRVERPRLP
ncbi:MAG: sulfatase-like hydrolase/transferase [Planctomycetes bacterium]|nr:sulfatase-like hydrolase/transferase [Planctomycetota bacterium]